MIEHFEPRFPLGLTATPERADGGDLLALCQQNLVYECALGRGIREGHLCPFHYFGIADLADYPNIPWRSLDEETLTTAVATQARAQNALEQWRARAGKRTVGFCVSKRHADFMRDYFRDHGGVRAASVHSGAGSDPRTASLQRLEAGELEVLFCVDMFNEGVDVPSIDTVLMLRPTESKVVWLQQLGRGLRRSAGKEHLTVLDYIGNHKIFIHKPEALLEALGVKAPTTRDVVTALREKRYRAVLPPGCEVSYELESIDLLERLFPPSRGAARIQEWYEEFREYNGRRPTALEAYQSSFHPAAVRSTHGSWFGFVRAMGDLGEDESRVATVDAPLLALVETLRLSRSHELLVLEAMLLRACLPGVITLPDLVGAFTTLAARSSRLRADVSVALDDEDAVERLLTEGPCRRLAADRSSGGAALFRLEAGTFGTTSAVRSDASSPLAGLVEELVEWRRAEHLDRSSEGTRFRVIQNASKNPIVKLDRKLAELPDGWATVLMQGHPYELKFAKEYVNVAREGQGETNVLPDLLRDWFGPDAGEPGRRFEVRHVQADDGTIRWQPEVVSEDGDAGVEGKGTQVLDERGEPLDARFAVEEREGVPAVVFMSRGGGRNDQYNEGLEVLLARLAKRGVSLARVQVESSGTRQIAAEGRTLVLEGFPYPVRLEAVADLTALRKAIGRAAAAMGRKPGATGSGNATKRLRLTLEVPVGVEVSEAALAKASSGE